MFGLGIWEIVIILAVALIVLGPRRLPEIARQLGRALREFRRATNELKYSLDEANLEEPKKPFSSAASQKLNHSETATTPLESRNAPPSKIAEPRDKTPREVHAEPRDDDDSKRE